jgi:hypothetical protein
MTTKLTALRRTVRQRGLPATLIATLSLLTAISVADAATWEREDIVGQGMSGPTVAPDGAAILRSPNGVTAQVSMPTPAPGSYQYSSAPTANNEAGHPEAFSLWVFIFFNPEACVGDCDEPDLANNPDVVAGAFNAGGHLAAGPILTVTGHVNHRSMVFAPPTATETVESLGEALDMGFDLADAEIHLAVAPHGGLDPELLPAQISTPAGPPSLWWIALFK